MARLGREDDDVLEPNEVELGQGHVLEHVEEEALELGELCIFVSASIKVDNDARSDMDCGNLSDLGIVLKTIALENDARAVAVAGKLRGLKLAHSLDVGQ